MCDDNVSVQNQDTTLSMTERTLGNLWCEVLQTVNSPKSTDNFFSLGGDSMAMVLMEFRIKEEFSVDLPAGTALMAPSLGELAAAIDAKLADAHTPVRLSTGA